MLSPIHKMQKRDAFPKGAATEMYNAYTRDKKERERVAKATKVKDELMEFSFYELKIEEDESSLAYFKEVKYYFLCFKDGWLTVWDLRENAGELGLYPGDVLMDKEMTVEDLMPFLISLLKEKRIRNIV